MGRHKSTKLFTGFSTVFRQWSAQSTHCRFLHGYAVQFRITFEGELDHRNWVFDFGGMKRARTKIDGMNPKDWMDYMFDHTTIVAKSDPQLEAFRSLSAAGVIQLREVEAIGAEKFAELVFNIMDPFVRQETENRVHIAQVEFSENGKNSAIYSK